MMFASSESIVGRTGGFFPGDAGECRLAVSDEGKTDIANRGVKFPVELEHK